MKIYVDIIKKQTEIIFKNIEFTFDFIDEKYWSKHINGFVLWKQLYHMLNSIDRIYTAPMNYQYPDFHIDGLNYLDSASDIEIAKDTLYKYFIGIKEKVINYFMNLNDKDLLEEVICQGMKLTRFDLALAQIRHITWHLGYIHSCIKQETGMLPEYIGVNPEYYPLY